MGGTIEEQQESNSVCDSHISILLSEEINIRQATEDSKSCVIIWHVLMYLKKNYGVLVKEF